MSDWSVMDWVHPSVRDTVIEYLVDHVAERSAFLKTTNTNGYLLALSTAGGSDGIRAFPLVRSEDDWTVLQELAVRLGDTAKVPEQNALLRATAAALAWATTQRPFDLEYMQTVAVALLRSLTHSWSQGAGGTTQANLRQFYDLTVELKKLLPSPSLDGTWRRARSLVDAVIQSQQLSDVDAESIREMVLLVSLLEENEPRFLRMLDYETEVGGPIGDVYKLARAHVENMEVLDAWEEVLEEENDTWRPIDPASDEWRERKWLTAMIPMLKDLISAAPSTEREALESSMQARLDERRQRQEHYDEWESQGEDDADNWAASRDQGSGDFDIAEFFADL